MMFLVQRSEKNGELGFRLRVPDRLSRRPAHSQRDEGSPVARFTCKEIPFGALAMLACSGQALALPEKRLRSG
jgi:hypothetical protein